MKTVLLHAPRSISVEEREPPRRPSGREVLVRIRRVTLCGSDLHYYRYGRNAAAVEWPVILGHEAAGEVLEVGDQVTALQPGDRVAIEPGQWCGECRYCRRNQYQFCSNMKFMASRGFPGALQEQVLWTEAALWKLPEWLSLEEGALLEPLSVAYSAIENIDFASVADAVVCGCGSIGLLAYRLIRLLHPHVACTLVDQYGERFELAARQGIELPRTIALQDGEADLPPTDLVIDTTGSPQAVGLAFRFLNKGGQISLIGLSQEKLGISMTDLVYKGVTLRGSFRYANTFPKLLALSKIWELRATDLITHRFQLESSAKAFETAASHECLKVVIAL